eukprot:1345236-Rhodomonas_salina.1
MALRNMLPHSTIKTGTKRIVLRVGGTEKRVWHYQAIELHEGVLEEYLGVMREVKTQVRKTLDPI